MSLTAPFKLISRHKEEIIEPRDLNLSSIDPEQIRGGEDVSSSAKLFSDVLSGQGTAPQQAVVLANAATALTVVNPKLTFAAAYDKAQVSLESGKALKAFKTLIKLNQ